MLQICWIGKIVGLSRFIARHLFLFFTKEMLVDEKKVRKWILKLKKWVVLGIRKTYIFGDGKGKMSIFYLWNFSFFCFWWHLWILWVFFRLFHTLIHVHFQFHLNGGNNTPFSLHTCQIFWTKYLLIKCAV